MTLADIAEATGFSVSYLSKVERNQGSLTLDAISKICAAFDMDMIQFLSMDFNKDIVHVHKQDRKVVYSKEDLIKYELLTAGNMKKLKGLLITLYPDPNPNFTRIAPPHTTDELAYIIEGEMILAIIDKNGKTHNNLLTEGDSYYVYVGEKHALKCHGDKPCISVWSYVSPPCFADNNASQH